MLAWVLISHIPTFGRIGAVWAFFIFFLSPLESGGKRGERTKKSFCLFPSFRECCRRRRRRSNLAEWQRFAGGIERGRKEEEETTLPPSPFFSRLGKEQVCNPTMSEARLWNCHALQHHLWNMLYSKCRHFWILTFGEFRTVCLGFWISLPPPPFSSSPPLSSLLFLRKIREKEHFAPPSRSLSPPATYYDVTNKRKEERRRPKCISVYFLFLPTSGENRSTFFPHRIFPNNKASSGGTCNAMHSLLLRTYTHTDFPQKKNDITFLLFPYSRGRGGNIGIIGRGERKKRMRETGARRWSRCNTYTQHTTSQTHRQEKTYPY